MRLAAASRDELDDGEPRATAHVTGRRLLQTGIENAVSIRCASSSRAVAGYPPRSLTHQDTKIAETPGDCSWKKARRRLHHRQRPPAPVAPEAAHRNMSLNKKQLKDVDVAGKRVLIRVDL